MTFFVSARLCSCARTAGLAPRQWRHGDLVQRWRGRQHICIRTCLSYVLLRIWNQRSKRPSVSSCPGPASEAAKCQSTHQIKGKIRACRASRPQHPAELSSFFLFIISALNCFLKKVLFSLYNANCVNNKQQFF